MAHARQPFRCAIVLGTTRKQQQYPTALQDHCPRSSKAPAFAKHGFYSGHTPTPRRFNHPNNHFWAPGNHPGSHGASCVSHSLHRANHVAIPFLGGASAVCPTRQSRHRFNCPFQMKTGQSFLGTERRSIPLPIRRGFSLLGIVFRTIHRQALAGRSWLSYS